MLRHAALFFLTASFPAIALAEVSPDVAQFVKSKGDPNALGYLAVADEECPVTTAELKDTVEGVFIRSRLKPESFIPHADTFYLRIGLNCMRDGDGSGNYIFNLQTRWAQFAPPRDCSSRRLRHLWLHRQPRICL